MTVSNTIFNKQLERAMARNAAKKAPELKTEPAKAKLSDEELQSYIDLLLEASKPVESVDLTKQILLKRFPKQD
ncbi:MULTISPECIES: hypothetical protein [Pseudomonas]|uniref:DUF1778 domain-containing protein n=1 Tax=Pseudomonas poae TaxID=200451 RepID=A0ABY0RD66_9PSED|nr:MULTISPECIES: hypothetical protein [Pseudomonas]KRP46119.1 hypothetical protein TU75_20205 [Pseudomonas poae]UII72948.1 hypothetical protein LVW35_07155 [Pseudomonas sp. HN11]SDN71469.1 hypothetical protein SAMN04490208_1223 [Pseudomonas poae]